MAKIKKRKLKWKASNASQVIGYRLYWAEGGGVNYDSEFEFLGNVTEIILPDDVKTFPIVRDTIELGVTALNEIGNESNMIKINAHFQFSIPHAPQALMFEKSDGHYTFEEPGECKEPLKKETESNESDQENYDFNLFRNKMNTDQIRDSLDELKR